MQTFNDAVSRLDDHDLNSWFSIRFAAGSRELEAAPLPPTDEAAIRDGFQFVRVTLEPPAARECFATLLARVKDLKGADACTVQEAALSGAERMPPPLAERFLRRLAELQP